MPTSTRPAAAAAAAAVTAPPAADPPRELAHAVLSWTSLWILFPAFIRLGTAAEDSPFAVWWWTGPALCCAAAVSFKHWHDFRQGSTMQKADQFFARLMLVTHSFFLCKWGKVLEMAGFVLPTLGLYVHSSPPTTSLAKNRRYC